LPVCTLAKLTVEGLAVSDPAVTPVPESPTARDEFDALLTRARLPLAAPLAWGANATLKLVLCPAARVKGKPIPLKLNPEPVAEAWVMVTLDPPEFVRVSDAVWLMPV
jgi:hypothetical protein